MNHVVLVYPYYRNPRMLELQVNHWNTLAASYMFSRHVSLILVDDASPEPAEPILASCTLPYELYRINENIPWNQHGARNLGAQVARSDDSWLLMTDMDILVPTETLSALVVNPLDPCSHYTFERSFVDRREPKSHCNTFLVTRRNYWAVGGYDEDFCGSYGGDGIFLRALEQIAPRRHLLLPVIGYNDVIEDCSTRDWGRKNTEFHQEYLRRRGVKKSSKEGLTPKNPLRFTWKRVR